MVQIRARFPGDLDALRERYLPTLSACVHIPGRDYPERAYCTREAFAEAAGKIALDTVYGNFKDAVTREQGHERHNAYLDVWSALRRHEPKGMRPDRANPHAWMDLPLEYPDGTQVQESAPRRSRRSKKH